jgi:hypothetical protein
LNQIDDESGKKKMKHITKSCESQKRICDVQLKKNKFIKLKTEISWKYNGYHGLVFKYRESFVSNYSI